MLTAPQRRSSKNVHDRRRQLCRRWRRSLVHFEQLEDRRLLAVLFADSFEVPGEDPPEWLHWSEDTQNDWFRGTRRATDGSYSAEVDGRATDATLTLTDPIDLSGYGSAELTFSWYIESGWDGGEYIALDLYDGSSWNEVRSLQGNTSDEGAWQNETVTIDGSYLVGDFNLRFRAKVSKSSEDGHVDDVQLTAENPTPPDVSISDAVGVEGTYAQLISDELNRPRGISLGPDGRLYVANGEDDRVLRFDASTGDYLDEFVSSGAGGLDNPQGLVFDANGQLYVSSGNGDSVLRFNGTTGAFIDVFVSTASGGLDLPVGLEFDSNGDLLVASYNSDEVLRYDGSTGTFLGAFVAQGSGGLNAPAYMTIGPDDHLYVTNAAEDTVEKYDGTTGTYLGQFVTPRSGGLDAPRGLLLDDGNLFVSSYATNEVLRFDATTGSFLDIHVGKNAGLITPMDLVKVADGSLYITNRDGSDMLRHREARSAEFTVSLSAASSSEATVDFNTVNGTAQAGSDYVASSGTVTFPPGTTSQLIVVPLIDDSLEEPEELFDVVLSNPVGANLPDPMPGTAKVADDDAPRPTDPQFPDLWNLNNTGQFGGTVDADIDAPEAWAVTQGSMETVVAVIDTGIDYTHNDLYLNIWLNEGEIPSSLASSLVDSDSDGIITFHDLNDPANSSYVVDHNATGYIDGGDLLADLTWSDGVDTDGNGYIDDLIGWDTRDDDNDPLDEHNHGTHIAGILAALHGNEFGGKGLNANVRLMPLRFKYNNPTWTSSDAVEAIDYAVAMDAPISSNSWGDDTGVFIQEIYDAIDRARLAGHLFVASAGNHARDTDAEPRYPADYDLDNIVSVAATNKVDQLASFSNWGLTSVDLAAPGDSILSTRRDHGHGIGSGTSYATPHVAATAALVHGLQPDWTADQIKAQILSTVDALPVLNGKMVSGGRLNAAAAVASTNSPPVALADSYSVAEDDNLNVAAPGVLDYDSDADGDSLTAVLVGGAANGWVSLSADGSFTYTPDADFNGADSFTYKANDGTSDSNVAAVSITVTPVNDAPVANGQSVTTDEDTSVAITVTGSDVDGDPLSYLVVSGPGDGSLSGTAPNLTYTPNADFNGSDSFTFKVNDGSVDSSVATVAITVNAVNDPPTISDIADQAIDEDTSTGTIAFTVGDPETPASSLTLSGSSSNTTLVPNANIVFGGSGANRTVTVTPALNQFGTATISVTVSDGSDSAQATFILTVNSVNDAPVADSQSVSAKENTPKTITLTASDVDGDALTYSVFSGPSNGTLGGTAPNLTYTPNAGYTGPDSFTFQASDGTLVSNEATVSITVVDNTPPVANAQSVETAEDTSLPITLTGSDPDGDPITYVVVNGPANGSISGTAPNLTYSPNADYSGADSFTFKVNDGTDDSALATVSITVTPVNDAPVADSQLLSTDEDTPVAVNLTGSDIDGDALTYSVVAAPANGSLSGTAPNLMYTPNADYNGSDSFTFKVNDGSLDSSLATVSITVSAVNDAPVAADDGYGIDEGGVLTVPAPGVLANDTDVDGDPLTATLVSGPSNGILAFDEDGSFDYTPNAGFVGSDSFVYEISDGQGGTDQATVSITVNAVSSGPNLAHGVVNVGSSWQTVNLSRSYDSMIVVATPNYDSSSTPAVVRIRNASGNSFEIRVDAAGPTTVGAMDVHYIVVEEGVYDEAGYKLEAVKYLSTVTDENNSWSGESRNYQQSYTNPVVIGQVMTYNDPDWSVFWAAGSSRTAPPSSTALTVGKHVGEDSDVTRANETVGYIVIETSTSGTSEIEGLPYVAAVGGDSIKGVGDSPSYNYSYSEMPNSKTAVVSQAGMDGGNGGWAVLYGNAPITPTGSTLKLAIDEDQSKDTERKHTTEQVAYFIIDPPTSEDSVAPLPSQVLSPSLLEIATYATKISSNRPRSKSVSSGDVVQTTNRFQPPALRVIDAAMSDWTRTRSLEAEDEANLPMLLEEAIEALFVEV